MSVLFMPHSMCACVVELCTFRVKVKVINYSIGAAVSLIIISAMCIVYICIY